MGMIALPICIGIAVLIIIIAVTIGVYSEISSDYSYYGANKSKKKAYKITTITTGVVLSIGIVVGMFFWGKYYVDDYNSEYTETVYEEIYSLDRGTEVSGSFTLGSGSVEENIVYYFYVETDRGFQLKSVSADYNEIYLIEDDGVTPHLDKIKQKGEYPYYAIYVPEGTIVRQFQG